MDERKEYNIILADGTALHGVSDGVGNFIIDGTIEKDALSPANLSEVQIKIDDMLIDSVSNQVIRTHYFLNDGKTFIRFSDMTELEKIEFNYNAKLDYIACMTGVDLDE